jgi:alkanesulfonate monooxygenase SsuD/methylene tetrahydromethanopterin reductase-like flavin-dependent oxidoreductase (luciferase family)
MPYLYSPRRYAASVERIREIAHQHGRALDAFGWYAFVFVNIDPDGRRARDGAVQTLGGNYNQDFRGLIDNVAAAGTTDEVGERIQAFVNAGARHFIFVPAAGSGDPDVVIRRLFEDVIPNVQVPTAGL